MYVGNLAWRNQLVDHCISNRVVSCSAGRLAKGGKGKGLTWEECSGIIRSQVLDCSSMGERELICVYREVPPQGMCQLTGVP